MDKKGIYHMKLLQLNVWNGGKLPRQITQLVEEEKPDFLCLQEASSVQDYTGIFFSVEEMQELFDLPYLSFAPGLTFNFMRKKASLGNAILSRHPFTRTETIYTNLGHNEDFDFSEHDYNIRSLLHCTIDTSEDQLHLLTHHGHHVPSHKDGTDDTVRQMKQIHEYISNLEGPTILTGDFNLSPHSASLEIINKSMRNLSIEHRLKTTRNFLTEKQEVCDYIFVNGSVTVKKFYMSDKIVSDHTALILEFDA